MADTVSPEVRSRIMSRIRGKNTQPEMILRRGLHALGFRYRLHDRKLPGTPDLTFPRRRVALFVHGCFWHGHDCPLFRWPKTREEFWRAKITRNIENDRKHRAALRADGLRVGVVWECAIKRRDRSEVDAVIRRVARWIEGCSGEMSVSGETGGT